MNPPLTNAFLNAGLIQYGLFGDVPFRLNFHLLPSYPDVLKQIVEALEQYIDFARYERLLCASDALPSGMAVSLHTGIPLVYSRGMSLAPVHDLIGAYDVGHPALLIINVWDGGGEVQNLVAAAQQVGLKINAAASLVGYQDYTVNGVQHVNLLGLSEVTTMLAEQNRVPAPQAEAVQRWIESAKARD